MVKSRKQSSRRQRKQSSRRQRKQSSRRSRQRSQSSRRQQRGGGSCAALPSNSMPVQQRGGMAPIGSSDLLLDKPTMVQAESAQQMADIEAAVAMARSQSGGARDRSRRQRSQSSRRHRQSRRQRSQSSRSRRQQRGGMMDFDSAFGPIQGPTASENAMWQSETQVNGQYLYGSGVHQLRPAA